jgi:hypothetical protein
LCAFDDEKFVFKAIDTTSNYYFYQAGNISPIEFSFETVPASDIQFLFQFENICYYKYRDYVSDKIQNFMINSNGIVSHIVNPNEDTYFNDLFVFDNRLYMFLFDQLERNSSQLYTLSKSSVEPEASYIIYDDILLITSFWSTPNNFYILSAFECYLPNKCSPAPGVINQLLVYDKSFNIINSISGFYISTYSVETTNDRDFLLKKGSVDELFTVNNGLQQFSVKDPNVDILRIVGGNEENLYIQGIDRLKERVRIYKLENKINISKQLNGLWVSDDWQSQGLSLHTGIRPDQSEYLFASFYIYKEGQPFWVAGNIDMDIGSDSISIPLSEYMGSSFLADDPGNETEQNYFGDLTITPQTCNSIDALIHIKGSETVELNLRRITDTSYENICSDLSTDKLNFNVIE